MATKNITITEEAYGRLKAHKREDESFSDVVTRLTTSEDKWNGYGALRDVEGFREAVERGREEFDRDVHARERELWDDARTGDTENAG